MRGEIIGVEFLPEDEKHGIVVRVRVDENLVIGRQFVVLLPDDPSESTAAFEWRKVYGEPAQPAAELVEERS